MGQEVISKSKEQIVSVKVTVPKGKRGSFTMQSTSSSLGAMGMERAHVTDCLTGPDQRIPVRLHSWGRLKLQLGRY